MVDTDIERLRDTKGTVELSALTRTIVWSWKRDSTINCLVISPALELMGRQAVNEFLRGNMEKQYRLFLIEALGGKRPGLGEKSAVPLSSSRSVVLSRVQPSIEVLDTFRTPVAGFQDYTVVIIDATAFENGGVLTVDIQVGRASPLGSFDLFDGNSEFPAEGTSDGALAHAWGIQPGGTGKIIYRFDKGQIFRLRATGGWVGQAGSMNAFRARISVQ